jgi:hypothetical protein
MTPAHAWPVEAALAEVARTVAPYLGETMAGAAVELHRQKLGIEGTHITGDQLNALMDRMRTGLTIFVGREKTERIVQDAHAAVASLGAQA